MHEYPITEEIIRIASNAAQEKNALKVTKIALVIGDLCGYAADSIHMYFDEISKGTLCEGCSLNIKRVKPALMCTVCSNLFEREPYSFKCPACGADAHPTETGTEFYVDYIEVEQKE